VLYLDEGVLAVEVDPDSPAPAVIFAGVDNDQGRAVQPGEHVRLRAGEGLTLSPFVRYRLRSDHLQPKLRAYEVAFPRFVGTGSTGPGLANATAVGPPLPAMLPEQELLAEAAHTGLPHDALIASFGRITLLPGQPLALAEASGPVLLTTEAGTLVMERVSADAVAVATRLVPGEAMIVPCGEATTLQAVGSEPVVIFAVSILPTHKALNFTAESASWQLIAP
jgi:mannose-6-phosphate isomerase-like protein (cupin superfamily)